MRHGPLVVLAQADESTHITVNHLDRHVGVDHVIIEEAPSRRSFLAHRLKRLGGARVFGQVLFIALVVPMLRRSARARAADIKRAFELDDRPIAESRVSRVVSANSPETIQRLRAIRPAAVVLCGTRIISAEVLGSVETPFVNLHAGITPMYRGVHGGYWALADGDPEHCGVTVHVVDAGIDTGPILAQATIAPGPEDSFVTYPLLQLGAGLPLLASAAVQALAGEPLATRQSEGPSKAWSHPTLPGYLSTRRRRGVR